MYTTNSHKLHRKFLMLALLVGSLVFFAGGRRALAYGESEQCDNAYNSCISFCNGSSVCAWNCSYQWYMCSPEVQPEYPPVN